MIKSNGRKFSTQRDVAKHAGVSVITVSRALNPLCANLLNNQTRQQVQRIARRLNYTPNIMARRLKCRKTNALSLILPPSVFRKTKYGDFSAHSSILFWELMEGILSEARKLNYEVILEPLFDPANPDSLINRIGYPTSDGALFLGLAELDLLMKAVSKNGIPYVLVGTFPQGDDAMPEVTVDTQKGFYEAVRYLIGAGHKTIGFMTYYDQLMHSWLRGRYLGYRDALLEAGLFDEKLIFHIHNRRELRRWVSQHAVSLPFTAVACCSDALADPLIEELSYTHVAIPGDLAVVGCDNNPMMDRLSTVALPRGESGREAVRLLINIIEKRESAVGKRVLPASFIKRGTC